MASRYFLILRTTADKCKKSRLNPLFNNLVDTLHLLLGIGLNRDWGFNTRMRIIIHNLKVFEPIIK